MKITLVRHGCPTVSLGEWEQGRSLRAFIDRYNQAGIAPHSKPSKASLNAIQNADCVITSDYLRTLESAKILGLVIQKSMILFREVDCWVDFPMRFPLPIWCWLLLTRVLWPLNLIRAPETYIQAQMRAKQGAMALMELAQIHGHVLLVGHGGMNTLIARELINLGWQGTKHPNLFHWGATPYLYSGKRPSRIGE